MGTHNYLQKKIWRIFRVPLGWGRGVARIICPHTPGKGVYKPENFVKLFPKVYPLPVITFEKMGFKNFSTNEYLNEFVVILKSINFKIEN